MGIPLPWRSGHGHRRGEAGRGYLRRHTTCSVVSMTLATVGRRVGQRMTMSGHAVRSARMPAAARTACSMISPSPGSTSWISPTDCPANATYSCPPPARTAATICACRCGVPGIAEPLAAANATAPRGHPRRRRTQSVTAITIQSSIVDPTGFGATPTQTPPNRDDARRSALERWEHRHRMVSEHGPALKNDSAWVAPDRVSTPRFDAACALAIGHLTRVAPLGMWAITRVVNGNSRRRRSTHPPTTSSPATASLRRLDVSVHGVRYGPANRSPGGGRSRTTPPRRRSPRSPSAPTSVPPSCGRAGSCSARSAA